MFSLSGMAVMCSEKICIPSALFIRSGMVFICSEKACISRHCTALIPAAFSATVRVFLTEPIAASLAISLLT